MVDQNGSLIVGIGASAGGIQAVKRFLERVPADSGVAFVVVLHLSPEHLSSLAEVLGTSTHLPVTQVHERVLVQPNHVYVIPPNRSLRMQDGSLEVSEVTRFEERRAPVDIFFRTLAESHHNRAVAVVLSGTGANGSMGIKRIKELGGITIVQDPEEAEYGDMPRNSIATRLVDHVLPVAAIPRRILAYRDTFGAVQLPEHAPEQPQSDEHALRDIFAQLRVRTGHDFSNYKRATVLRRIARRMSLNDLTEIGAYALFVREHPEESQALLKDLLISVTNFFRDRDVFETLEKQVIPKLFEGKGEDDLVRVWIAGCATGEEAYSIAMLLAEYSASVPGSPAIQLFATDIDEAAVAVAREGLYTLNDAADVSPERLRRFFIKEGELYRVRKELREMILFAHHNLIKDPPFSHLNLVSCRNLLIYLNRSAQKRVMEVIHFALNPGGFLFLGSSESIDGSGDLFVAYEKDAYLFQSRAIEARVAMPVPDLSLPGTEDRRFQDDRASEQRARERLSAADLHLRLLEQYAPPSVVVNEDHLIVHLSDTVGRYMQYSAGEPSHNVLHAIRPELRIELRTALYQAAQQRTIVEAPGLIVRIDDRIVTVDLTVRPVVREDDSARGFFLVVFRELPEDAADVAQERVTPLSSGDTARQLEEEVVRVKAQLRATIERHETQAEELKASNEELQAMNEELRSSAEELETSKEELQSLNEELRTVNQELKIKVEEQAQANDDIQNLINSTEIGTIFLDRASRIKLFTPRARDLFTLIPADRGRPLSDINSSLVESDLHQDLERVLDRLERVEREVRTRDDGWRLMRALPYRTSDDRIDGIVLTFVDITARKRIEEALRASEERLRRAIAIDTVGVVFFNNSGQATDANDAFLRMSGYTRDELNLGHVRLDTMTPPALLGEAARALSELLETGQTVAHEQQYVWKNGARWWGMFAATRLGPNEGVGFVVDVSGRKRAEEDLRETQNRMRLVIESVSDYAIFTIDAKGIIDSWNPGAARMFGWQEDQAIGQPVAMIYTPEDRERGVPEDEMVRAERRGRASDERWHLKSDGSTFFASGVVAPLRDGHNSTIGFVKVARDLTERKRWDEALQQTQTELEARVSARTAELATANASLDTELQERRQAEEQIRALMRRLLSVQEDERRRIARDLHDNIGQQIAGLHLKIDALTEVAREHAELEAVVEDAQRTISKIDRELDFFAWKLRPAALTQLGLPATLGNFVREWSKEFEIPAEYHTRGLDSIRLPFEVEANVYRIAQEALNNVYKHAKASRVGIILERRRHELVLLIEDDGTGFDLSEHPPGDENRGIGLAGMSERAALIGGRVEIESEKGKGTTVFVRLPVQADEADR